MTEVSDTPEQVVGNIGSARESVTETDVLSEDGRQAVDAAYEGGRQYEGDNAAASTASSSRATKSAASDRGFMLQFFFKTFLEPATTDLLQIPKLSRGSKKTSGDSTGLDQENNGAATMSYAVQTAVENAYMYALRDAPQGAGLALPLHTLRRYISGCRVDLVKVGPFPFPDPPYLRDIAPSSGRLANPAHAGSRIIRGIRLQLDPDADRCHPGELERWLRLSGRATLLLPEEAPEYASWRQQATIVEGRPKYVPAAAAAADARAAPPNGPAAAPRGANGKEVASADGGDASAGLSGAAPRPRPASAKKRDKLRVQMELIRKEGALVQSRVQALQGQQLLQHQVDRLATQGSLWKHGKEGPMRGPMGAEPGAEFVNGKVVVWQELSKSLKRMMAQDGPLYAKAGPKPSTATGAHGTADISAGATGGKSAWAKALLRAERAGQLPRQPSTAPASRPGASFATIVRHPDAETSRADPPGAEVSTARAASQAGRARQGKGETGLEDIASLWQVGPEDRAQRAGHVGGEQGGAGNHPPAEGSHRSVWHAEWRPESSYAGASRAATREAGGGEATLNAGCPGSSSGSDSEEDRHAAARNTISRNSQAGSSGGSTAQAKGLVGSSSWSLPPRDDGVDASARAGWTSERTSGWDRLPSASTGAPAHAAGSTKVYSEAEIRQIIQEAGKIAKQILGPDWVETSGSNVA
eukprot:jgi/Mesvir1/25444/Mv01716-RA.1